MTPPAPPPPSVHPQLSTSHSQKCPFSSRLEVQQHLTDPAGGGGTALLISQNVMECSSDRAIGECIHKTCRSFGRCWMRSNARCSKVGPCS